MYLASCPPHLETVILQRFPGWQVLLSKRPAAASDLVGRSDFRVDVRGTMWNLEYLSVKSL